MVDEREENKKDKFTQSMTEVLIRLASLEKLLLDKNIFSKEELLTVINDNINKFKSELEKQLSSHKKDI